MRNSESSQVLSGVIQTHIKRCGLEEGKPHLINQKRWISSGSCVWVRMWLGEAHGTCRAPSWDPVHGPPNKCLIWARQLSLAGESGCYKYPWAQADLCHIESVSERRAGENWLIWVTHGRAGALLRSRIRSAAGLLEKAGWGNCSHQGSRGLAE